MIHSMTGYARVEATAAGARLIWELRSVNHRYLDVQFKLPDEFRVLELDLRQLVGERLARGKVEAGLRYARDSSGETGIAIDVDRIAQLRAALDTVCVEMGAGSVPDPLRVLSFPGVMRETQTDLSTLHQEARGLFAAALDEFTALRRREGERLQQFLFERCDLIEGLVGEVRDRYPLVRDQWLAKLKARCDELGVEVDAARLAQELALMAQRLDVEEEMSRLLSHLIEVRQALKRGEAVGRRLDFLMQELNREANTLSSKSQDAEMTRCAVEMKVAIEQMREQVQNIE